MSDQPSLNIEALARLDLRPDEILAVTYGMPGMTPLQCAEAQDWLAQWLADHGQPVAGVLVLPQGTGLAAIRAPKPVTLNIDFRGSALPGDKFEEWVREFTRRSRRDPPDSV